MIVHDTAVHLHVCNIHVQCDTFDDMILFVYSSHIVRYGKLEVVKYLIEVEGCSTGCTDESGQTPLHRACR